MCHPWCHLHRAKAADPLAELVKIDPKSIGVGQYQHDLNQGKLGRPKECGGGLCEHGGGGSEHLLPPFAICGWISPSIAKNIVKYREERGRFHSREELKEVKRLGDKAFEQCAGFLRIAGGANPLDNTAVHPESYGITEKFLEILGYTTEDVRQGKLKDIDDRIGQYGKGEGLKPIAQQLGVGLPTLRDILEELKKPGRDPREEMPKPIFRRDVLRMEDLKVEMIMTGTVRNVVDFGAFVDIGVKQDGLVHISQLSNRFVRNPMEVVAVGDEVKVRIIGLDLERGKISLSMKEG